MSNQRWLYIIPPSQRNASQYVNLRDGPYWSRGRFPQTISRQFLENQGYMFKVNSAIYPSELVDLPTGVNFASEVSSDNRLRDALGHLDLYMDTHRDFKAVAVSFDAVQGSVRSNPSLLTGDSLRFSGSAAIVDAPSTQRHGAYNHPSSSSSIMGAKPTVS